MSIPFDLTRNKKDIRILEKCECVSAFVQLNSVMDMLEFVRVFCDMADNDVNGLPDTAAPAIKAIMADQIGKIYELCLMLYPQNDEIAAEDVIRDAKINYS